MTNQTMTADDVAHFEVTRERDEVARRVLATYAECERLTAENARLMVCLGDAQRDNPHIVTVEEYPEHPPAMSVQIGYGRTATFTPRGSRE